MTLPWLVTLVVYGALHAWEIPTLYWLLLVPMVCQDVYDGVNRRK